MRYVLTAPGVALPLPLALRDASAWVYERPQALPVVRLEGSEPGAALAHRRLGPGWVRAGVRVAGPSGLATSIYDDRHWRVLVDGERRAPPARDAPFVAAALRRGDRVVDLLYRPASWVWGWLVAAVAAGAAVAWLCPPPARARMTA